MKTDQKIASLRAKWFEQSVGRLVRTCEATALAEPEREREVG